MQENPGGGGQLPKGDMNLLQLHEFFGGRMNLGH